MFWGLPIWVSTLSNHWRGPCRWTSIQQGVEVTSCRWYSAPQPLTKDILMVHILVSSYTASNPWLTDCERRAANSWLLKILRLQPGGILQTVVGWNLSEVVKISSASKIYLPVVVVAVSWLHKDCRVWETLGVHLASDIIQMHTLADMSAGVFNCWVPETGVL